MSLPGLETGRRENLTDVIRIPRHPKSPSPEAAFGIDRLHPALRRSLLDLVQRVVPLRFENQVHDGIRGQPNDLSRVDRLFRLDDRATTEILPLPPRSALAVALDYLPVQRASLTRCETTPGAYPDNNGLSEKRCRRARCALGLKALPTRTVPRGPLDR